MKKLNVNEMRSVEGGTIYYQTHCGAIYSDKSVWSVLALKSHGLHCSDCIAAKKVWGYYYTFNSKNALVRAWR